MLIGQKEFIVTLKNFSFLDQFYIDMETEGTTIPYIPSRSVECVYKRPISRNTHYLLTDDEVKFLVNDSRVESINIKNKNSLINTKLHVEQTSLWNRNNDITIGEKNWGLYRSQLENNISGWGSENSVTDTETSTIKINGTGKNVDIIFIDETAYPLHSEYSNRFVQYDWFANHNSTVWPSNTNNNYTYTEFNQINNHATHVIGIAAGNTQGWARESNIYNIKHDSSGNSPGSFIPPEFVIDYVRAFHNSKPVNPETGRKNPTIVNNSWGFESANNALNLYTNNSNISKIVYRGSTITAPGSTVDTGISGICSSSVKIADFASLAPNSGNRITTTGISTGSISAITFSDTNRVGLTDIGPPTATGSESLDSNDDASWSINLPFSISYLTQSHSSLNVSSNSYIGFSSIFNGFPFYSESFPAFSKIFISAGDRYGKSIWTGTFETTPNRTFIIRFEGFDGPYAGIYETNPTLIWEMKFYESTPNQIDVHIIQNSVYRSEFSSIDLLTYGVQFNNGSPVRNVSIDADIQDAINEGIIFVGSAGNNSTKIDLSNGQDYNNYFVNDGLPVYYHRGPSPGAGNPDVICVGALNSDSSESKTEDSNTGPRVDIYAPGNNIISSVYDNTLSVNDTVGNVHLTISGGYAGDNGLPGQGAGIAVIVTTQPHGLTTGDTVSIENCSNSVYNISNASITVVDTDSFRFNISNTVYNSILELLTGTVKVGFLFQKSSGTSTAVAQVTGILALALEKYPWMNQVDAKNYILKYAKENKMFNSLGGYSDSTSLQGGNNKIVFFHKERPDLGILSPKSRQWLRPNTGQVYPRPQIRKK